MWGKGDELFVEFLTFWNRGCYLILLWGNNGERAQIVFLWWFRKIWKVLMCLQMKELKVKGYITVKKLKNKCRMTKIFSDDDNCPTCETVLAELETIDDETDEVGIQFVKTNDVEVAEDLGISHLPALVYFEGGVPSIYDGRYLQGKVRQWEIIFGVPVY